MRLLPHVTTEGEHGPVHTIEIDSGHAIQVVPSPHFDKLATEGAVVRHRGKHFAIAECCANGRSVFVIKNSTPPNRTQIDRDDAWHKRIELGESLPDLLRDKVALSPTELKHSLPLSLLTASYKEAFCGNPKDEDVLRSFTRNTQRRFEKAVGAYLKGSSEYDAEAYSRQGIYTPDYSHINHLGWLYAQQFRLVSRILDSHPDRTITVLDLGTGGGHFILTLAVQLALTRRLARVKLIGIDRTERDMRFARELLADLLHAEYLCAGLDAVAGIHLDFCLDDLSCPGFADRLRRLRPDVVVANHIVEHLPGEIKNRYLHDWLLSAKIALSVSVPLGDKLSSSISENVQDEFTADGVEKLARDMELRVAYAAEAQGIEQTKYAGLCTWMKKREVQDHGGLRHAAMLTLKPKDVSVKPDPILADFAKPFDPAEFNKVRRAPKIGEIQDKETFQQERHEPSQVRQLLIKMPGTAVMVPAEFAQFREAVQIIIDHNKAVNPDFDCSYLYLNVFRGKTNFDSYRGLSLNCHPDQMQTLMPGYAFKPDWSYIVSNTLPTILFEQPFDLSQEVVKARAGLDVNIYDYLNKTADKAKAYHTENFCIYLLSPYVIHSASDAQEVVFRVFMKVAISTKRFWDNRELRRSPAFDNESWYQYDTVGYIGGFFSHAHWNERFVKADLSRD